MSGQLY